MSLGPTPAWTRGPRFHLAAALLVAIASWGLHFRDPVPGGDPSSNAGLYMAAHQGLSFGVDLVYTYGPLGFLGQAQPTLWYADLAALSFAYGAILFLTYCLAITWALCRTIGPLPGALAAFAVVALLPSAEEPLVIAVALSTAILTAHPPRHALWIAVAGGATLAAVESLVKLSIGPAVALALALALFGARAERRHALAFVGLLVVEVPLLWLLAGQDLGTFPDYVRNSAEVISGYSEAMGSNGAPAWQRVAGALALVGTVLLASRGDWRDRRARLAATAAVAVIGYAAFKEGVVRFDVPHVAILLSTLSAIAAVNVSRGRDAGLVLAGLVALLVLTRIVIPSGLDGSLNPVHNAREAASQLRLLVDSGAREERVSEGRAGLQAKYALEPRMLAEVEGHSVAVDPWEAALAWAYELDWSPLPVFQNYAAYTERLDRLNADRAADPDGPQRIIRVNPIEAVGDAFQRSIDGRYPAWDPPAEALAILCNFDVVSESDSYQVLARVPDRCGEPELIGSVEAGAGEAVEVPPARRGEVVFATVEGADVTGVERLVTAAYRAEFRFAEIDSGPVRLVPGTAADGLLMRGDPRIVGEGPFGQAPQTTSVAIDGAGDDLRFDFFRMSVAGSGDQP